MSGADSRAVDAEARIGSVLRGKWRLERLLGVGGMAAVYEARHTNGSRVAVKILHRHSALSEERLSRFKREGYAANRVGHPGVPEVFDDDIDEHGSPFLVMELLSGETLAERAAASGGRLGPKEVLEATERVLEILSAAHSRGILHRDIKPENLFATEAGDIKVLDFGIARLADVELGHTRTEAGVVLGTPAFAAPEQARGAIDSIDARTDIWAVGASMFTLLTGRFVHEATTANEQLGMAMTASAPSLADIIPDAPAALVIVVDRALAYSRDDRFADANSMLEAVRWVRSHWDDLQVSPPGQVPTEWARTFGETNANKARTLGDEKPDARPVPVQSEPSRAAPRRSSALGIVGASVALLASGAALTFAAYPLLAELRRSPAAPAKHEKAADDGTIGTGRMKWLRNFIGHWSLVFDVAVDPTDTYLVTASDDGTAKVWNIETGSMLRSLTGHQARRVSSVIFTPDGKNVVTGSDAIRVFDLATGNLLRTMKGHDGEVMSVAVSHDGKELVSTGVDGTTRFWDFATGEERAHFKVPKRCLSVSWSPDGGNAAVGCDDGNIYILDATTALRKFVHVGHVGPVDEVAFSPDGKTLVSAGDDHTVRVWADAWPSPMHTIEGHTNEAWAISVSPDGKSLLTGSKDGTFRLWDLYSGNQLDVVQLDMISGVLFLHDGQRFIVARANGVAALFTLGVANWQPPKISSPVPHPPRTAPPGATEEQRLCIAAHQALDEARSKSNHVSEARHLANLALAKTPKSACAHVALARAEYLQQRGAEYEPKSLERAQADVDKALAIDPNFVLGHVTRAYVFAFQKDLKKADESAQRARQLDRDDPRVLVLSALLGVWNRRYDEGFSYAKRAIETTQDPDLLAKAYSTLVDVYTNRDDPNAAEDVYRSVVNLNPDCACEKVSLSKYLLSRGMYDESIEWARAAVAQTDDDNTRMALSDACADKAVHILKTTGTNPEVEGLVDEAQRAFARNAEAYYAGGLMHRAQGNALRANMAFRSALAIEPDHAGARAALEDD